MEDKTVKEIVFGSGIVVLSAIYLLMGNDGVAFAGAIAVLASAISYGAGRKRSD